MYSLAGRDDPTCLDQWRKFFEPLLVDPISVGQQLLTWDLLTSRPDALKNAVNTMNQSARELTLQNWRILCLSTHNDLLLMWAHYADRHRGICLEFSASTPGMGDAFEVVYQTRRPVVDCTVLADKVLQTQRALLTKSTDWAYENEYRFLTRNSDTDKAPTLSLRKTTGDFLDLEPNSLTGIIAGSRADFKAIEAIVRTHKPSLALYTAKQSDLEYKVLVEKVTM